eukprot:5891586-Pleurochrysis_carterae.AAC.1
MDAACTRVHNDAYRRTLPWYPGFVTSFLPSARNSSLSPMGNYAVPCLHLSGQRMIDVKKD